MIGPATVLLAGGGTGGHIYPNVAIAERLVALTPQLRLHFLVSNRPGDRQTMAKLGYPFTPSCVRPLPPATRPWRAFGFMWAWQRAMAETTAMIQAESIRAVVATGGFVSGPALVAARRLGLPAAMVNLDAVPGKANRRLRSTCSKVFSAYKSPLLPNADVIGLPLRRSSVGMGDPASARQRLGLAPDRPTLLITGATHGATSIILAMMALLEHPEAVAALKSWQVFHQCGGFDPVRLQAAYDHAGISARVVTYCDTMGDAWHSADLAISRAGAGSVAEAWANATPTLFLPNPYHADGHQRANATPMTQVGGAKIVEDHIEPAPNVADLGQILLGLLDAPQQRQAMAAALRQSRPPDGAEAVARWISDQLMNSPLSLD